MNISSRLHKFSGRQTRSRVYVFIENETILESLMNRRNRSVATMREAAEKAMDENGISGISLKWSQKAGCSCGCSPGFICDGYDPKLWGNDLFVTIEK